MMARLIKLAPRQETKDMLAAQSQWFADNEATYFEHFLEAYHVSREEYDATEPTPPTRSTAHTSTACPTRAGRN